MMLCFSTVCILLKELFVYMVHHSCFPSLLFPLCYHNIIYIPHFSLISHTMILPYFQTGTGAVPGAGYNQADLMGDDFTNVGVGSGEAQGTAAL